MKNKLACLNIRNIKVIIIVSILALCLWLILLRDFDRNICYHNYANNIGIINYTPDSFFINLNIFLQDSIVPGSNKEKVDEVINRLGPFHTLARRLFSDGTSDEEFTFLCLHPLNTFTIYIYYLENGDYEVIYINKDSL